MVWSNIIIAGASQASSGTYPGIQFSTGVDHASITNSRVGCTVELYVCTMKYNLQIDSGFTGHLTVVGGDYSGSVTANYSDSASATTPIVFDKVIGINPIGPSILSPGASPWTYTAGRTNETVNIVGGTVSSVAYTAGPITWCISSPPPSRWFRNNK